MKPNIPLASALIAIVLFSQSPSADADTRFPQPSISPLSVQSLTSSVVTTPMSVVEISVRNATKAGNLVKVENGYQVLLFTFVNSAT